MFILTDAACAFAAGVGEYYVNGLQVCNLQPVAGAPPATCAAAGGTCTALSNADVQVNDLTAHASQHLDELEVTPGLSAGVLQTTLCRTT